MASNTQEILDSLNKYLRSDSSYAKEPEWTMAIKVSDEFITCSTEEEKGSPIGLEGIVSLANLTPIHDYKISLTRGIEPSSVIKDFMPGGLQANELKVVAPFGSITGQVHATLSGNVLVDTVIIARLGVAEKTIKGINTVSALSYYIFKNAYITALVSKNDLISLAFRYTYIENGQHQIDPATGQAAGNIASSYHNLEDWGTTGKL